MTDSSYPKSLKNDDHYNWYPPPKKGWQYLCTMLNLDISWINTKAKCWRWVRSWRLVKWCENYFIQASKKMDGEKHQELIKSIFTGIGSHLLSAIFTLKDLWELLLRVPLSCAFLDSHRAYLICWAVLYVWLHATYFWMIFGMLHYPRNKNICC